MFFSQAKRVALAFSTTRYFNYDALTIPYLFNDSLTANQETAITAIVTTMSNIDVIGIW